MDQMKNLKGLKENDPDWITEIADALLGLRLDEFSISQKKMLRDVYFENIRDGLDPKEAIGKAIQIVNCFKS